LLRSLANKRENQPFFLSLALFALSYAGLGISMYPFIVPQSITIWQALRRGAASCSCWSCRVDPADPRLHLLGLLGIPRQGQGRERLS
jgi:hypothetical protein